MMPTRYEKRAGVIGCPYSIKCAMLKVKKSVNIFFFQTQRKIHKLAYIFRYSFDPAATKSDFL